MTIVEYFDYQCPYCKMYHPVLRDVVARDGNVRLVMKDWPIFGAPSVQASQLALGAVELGRYEAAHNALIEETLKAAGIDPGAAEEAYKANRDRWVGFMTRNSQQAAVFGTPGEIRLDGDVPHRAFEGIGRQLKSVNARRRIPLLGVSLAAMRDFPAGFARYRASSATLSATVNKHFRAHGLCESAGHMLYGLRHSFEDRMLAGRIDERVRRDLMGHALGRERYGEGGSLALVRSMLEPIAL